MTSGRALDSSEKARAWYMVLWAPLLPLPPTQAARPKISSAGKVATLLCLMSGQPDPQQSHRRCLNLINSTSTAKQSQQSDSDSGRSLSDHKPIVPTMPSTAKVCLPPAMWGSTRDACALDVASFRDESESSRSSSESQSDCVPFSYICCMCARAC